MEHEVTMDGKFWNCEPTQPLPHPAPFTLFLSGTCDSVKTHEDVISYRILTTFLAHSPPSCRLLPVSPLRSCCFCLHLSCWWRSRVLPMTLVSVLEKSRRIQGVDNREVGDAKCVQKKTKQDSGGRERSICVWRRGEPTGGSGVPTLWPEQQVRAAGGEEDAPKP